MRCDHRGKEWRLGRISAWFHAPVWSSRSLMSRGNTHTRLHLMKSSSDVNMTSLSCCRIEVILRLMNTSSDVSMAAVNRYTPKPKRSVMSQTASPYDALLLCSFGGPEKEEDVLP